MLKVDNLTAGYDESIVLREISLNVHPGEVVSLIGRNGAGKSTLVQSILGQTRIHSGSIQTNNSTEISTLPPDRIARQRIGVVLQGSRVFPDLTVQENLRLSAFQPVSIGAISATLSQHFPQLLNKRIQLAGTLSGGEQQMLAMARIYLAEPDVILLDEPTEGLMPSLVSDIAAKIRELQERGKAILLTEQNLAFMLNVATRYYVIENGSIADQGDASNSSRERLEAYLGL